MKISKTYTKFSKKQQSGIFFLLFFIGLFQGALFFVDFTPKKIFKIDEKGWVAHQSTIDSLKQLKAKSSQPKIYPFNPNYINDYKGYLLGMSITEIDRLLAYRKSGSVIYSAEVFQEVTQISDSLLRHIRPYFRFPRKNKIKGTYTKRKTKSEATSIANMHDVPKKDLNAITVEELKTIRGIGEVLSKRIVKFRDRLGGFLVKEQLYDVYGLSRDAADGVLQYYAVLQPPKIEKININTASVEELATITYIYYKTARAIVKYRDSVGKILTIEELTKIRDIPIEKIDRIKLYLETE